MVLLAAFAVAAEPADNSSATSTPPTETAKKPGFHVGSVRIRPTISLTARHDDNVFTTSDDAKSDWITLLSPQVRLDHAGERLQLQLKAGAEGGYHRRYDDEDYVDYWAGIDVQLKVNDNMRLFGAAGVSYDHESRDSLDAPSGALEPTTYRKAHANLGTRIRVDATTYQLGATWESLDFDNVPSASGKIINDDRDRRLFGLGIRATRRFTDRTEAFVQALYDERRYDQSIDQFGYRRSSDGYRAAFGVKHLFGPHEIEAYLGLITQDYDDRRFNRVRKPDIGTRIKFVPGDEYKINVKLQRTLNETTDVGSAGYLNTTVSASLDIAQTPRLSHSFGIGYTLSDYLDNGREDKTRSLSFSSKFFVTRNSYLLGGISHAQRDSNDAALSSGSNDFEKTVLFLSYVIQAYPLSH